MLKKEINESAKTKNIFNRNSNKTILNSSKTTLLDTLNKNRLKIHAANTILMFITIVLQLIIGNKVLHSLLCLIITLLCLLLNFLSRKFDYTPTKHYIFISALWGFNFLINFIDVIC